MLFKPSVDGDLLWTCSSSACPPHAMLRPRADTNDKRDHTSVSTAHVTGTVIRAYIHTCILEYNT